MTPPITHWHIFYLIHVQIHSLTWTKNADVFTVKTVAISNTEVRAVEERRLIAITLNIVDVDEPNSSAKEGTRER